ncbi:MAG: cysteine--tRNA ligase [Bacteroidetes bacterium]|nr:cysteine--tRNA ligase [Bacteroidota bacterium]MBU2505473.1 cysteine--tRNA ligase [Bacteroidota bacterium]
MLVYNTLTRKKEEFKPINPPNVTMYVCGPTVYDYFHIGNARSFIMADIIRRHLIFKEYNVTFVMNLTDIDDKIINKSIEEKIDSSKVSQKYVASFFEDIEKLKIKKADVYPKATEHMDEIISLIKNLEEKKLAYNSDGNLFFRVKEFKNYGLLSGKNTDDLELGSRVEVNEQKENPLDFSLWKKAKAGEPYWDSPWGKGRPGWHTECSAMSVKHLGKTIDIHAGGNDLIFPHHENEIAQSEGCFESKFVNYWMHFGFLNFQDEKMSKSLGNFFTARDILKKYSAEAIRLFFCQTHYSGPLAFSEELIASSEKGLEKISNFVEFINSKSSYGESEGVECSFDFDFFLSRFVTAMDDDFNTPQAVAAIFNFIKSANKYAVENPKLNSDFFVKAGEFIQKTAGDVLGIADFKQTNKIDQTLSHDLVNLLIEIRQKAKVEKNYSLADEIRDKLNSFGISLKDSKEGTTFKIS